MSLFYTLHCIWTMFGIVQDLAELKDAQPGAKESKAGRRLMKSVDRLLSRVEKLTAELGYSPKVAAE